MDKLGLKIDGKKVKDMQKECKEKVDRYVADAGVDLAQEGMTLEMMQAWFVKEFGLPFNDRRYMAHPELLDTG